MIAQETIGNVIKGFHLAINNLRIYPAASQIVTGSFDTFFKALNGALSGNESVTFSELSGKLLVNGTEAESREVQMIASIILKLLVQKKVQSITFRPGLDAAELSEFVNNLLRKNRNELGNSPHIALDQTVYVAMIKGEEAVIKISEMVHNSGSDIVGMITTVRESYDLIDKLPDAASRAQAQDHLANELAKQDHVVLREIFERELPMKIEESGLKKKLLGALTREKIEGIFGDITNWYEEVRSKEGSDFSAVEQLGKLKNFIQTVLSAPAAKELPRKFFEDMMRAGLIGTIPEWLHETAAKPATVFQVEQLLDKPASDLLADEVRSQLPQLAEKLCQIENMDLLGKLLEKCLGNLGNPAAKVRLIAARSISDIHDVLKTHSKETLIRFMEMPVLEACREEISQETHAILADILRQRARQNLLYGEYEPSLRIIDVLRQNSMSEVTSDEAIRQSASKTIALLIPEIMEVLIADMKSDNEVKRSGSLQVLVRIGDKAIDALIRVIKESDDTRSRRLAAAALKNIGDNGKKRFAEELNLGLTGEEIKRVVEVLSDIASVETLTSLQTLLRFPDAAVKRDIMRFISRVPTDQAKGIIIEQLKDDDVTVKGEAVRLLGELKCREAAPTLISVLGNPRTPYELKEEICVALAAIGSPDAVPALATALKTKSGGWFSKPKPEQDRVRMRAAWALRKFSAPEAISALETATLDKTVSVALTAKESLTSIRQPKNQ